MKRLLLGLMLVLVCAGCASSPKFISYSTSKVHLTDTYVNSFMGIGNSKVSWTADSRLSVAVTFFNKDFVPLKAQVMAIFKDSSGMEIERTNWQLVMIPAGDSFVYTANSLNDKASDFVIKCRAAK